VESGSDERLIALALTVLISACSGGGEAAIDASGPDGIPGVNCNVGGGAPAISFPTFDDDCTTADDCVLVAHKLDCCSTTAFLAISASEQAAFTAAETQCNEEFGVCGCTPGDAGIAHPVRCENMACIATPVDAGPDAG
jgi:hypothetical protein